MDYEWDPRKAAENLRKHGVDFADAVIALEDENALTIEDPDQEEQRFKTLGMGPNLNVLFVVHCERQEGRIAARQMRGHHHAVGIDGEMHQCTFGVAEDLIRRVPIETVLLDRILDGLAGDRVF